MGIEGLEFSGLYGFRIWVYLGFQASGSLGFSHVKFGVSVLEEKAEKA